MNACLMAAGFPRQTFLPLVQDTENHARAGIGGWLLTHSPKPGDLAMYTIKGAANHVGMVESINGSQMITIEGNTLADGEPQTANPDGVERRHRSVSSARSFARPPYSR
jgi:CHAP domain-containing protein